LKINGIEEKGSASGGGLEEGNKEPTEPQGMGMKRGGRRKRIEVEAGKGVPPS